MFLFRSQWLIRTPRLIIRYRTPPSVLSGVGNSADHFALCAFTSLDCINFNYQFDQDFTWSEEDDCHLFVKAQKDQKKGTLLQP